MQEGDFIYRAYMRPPKKIMIFGVPGSGKSTFAVELSNLLNLPVFHLDKYFYVENWQEHNTAEFLYIQERLVEKESWIIDGNALRSLKMRFNRADIALYFRCNRLVCLWRIFKRLFLKNTQIADRADGCVEKVPMRLIRYLWNFTKRVDPIIQELRRAYPNVIFYEIKNQKDIEAFLQKNASNHIRQVRR